MTHVSPLYVSFGRSRLGLVHSSPNPLKTFEQDSSVTNKTGL